MRHTEGCGEGQAKEGSLGQLSRPRRPKAASKAAGALHAGHSSTFCLTGTPPAALPS
eukprot:CAMPEP_0179164344 /NCGR_PEP_ID=MMETSP0796-20121207/80642_1 /TAXON_ID=73915 /ORGANISM="Pyrodinium bahamense, Strain pbaha01" /LENGTH=56 /DNA_ID=CAMNT_0020866773 /DNA_START=34 /DNA_END=200 /DNA_ORIENTATION=+